MNKQCIICKRKNNCPIYRLGGLRDGEWCKDFREEPEITEEEQEHQQQEQAKRKSVFKKLIEKLKHS